MATQTATFPHTGRWLALAQLIRLPNVFTAWADIFLAAMVIGVWPDLLLPFFALLMASTCLYWAGMVWNDYFDVEQDRRERPFRPLPSGKISLSIAGALGIGLMVAGLAFAASPHAFGFRLGSLILASVLAAAILLFFEPWKRTWTGLTAMLFAAAGLGIALIIGGLAVVVVYAPELFQFSSMIIASFLATNILLYDAWLKRTWAGPIAMGSCRFLNVLLGLSLAPEGIEGWGILMAFVVGIYIAGVTWFARKEAGASNPRFLLAAAGVMLAGLLLSLALPGAADAAGLPYSTSPLFPYLVAALGFYLGFPVARAIENPSPARVQAAVKQAVLGLILLDAVLATALAGTLGVLLALLLVPALYLGKWVYST